MKTLKTWGSAFIWRGFAGRQGKFRGFNLKIITPSKPRAGKPWIWKTEFLDAFANAEEELVRRGFYLVHLEVFDYYGCPKAVTYGNALYKFVTENFKFSRKVCLLGMSRGGLWAYNWAAANPEKVALIEGDNPVCDFKSWPGGLGEGPGHEDSWKTCLKMHGLNKKTGKTWRGNPIDNLEVLAKAKIPILHIIGTADEVVPVAENSNIVKERYRKLGGHFEEIVKRKGKHHPHGLPKDPTRIVEFFERHAGRKK